MHINKQHRTMKLRALGVLAFMFSAVACGAEKRSELLHLDCEGTALGNSVSIFDRRFIIPLNFEKDTKNESGFVLKAATVVVFDSPVIYDEATIRYGSSSGSKFEEWNQLGYLDEGEMAVEILELKTELPNGLLAYELALVSATEFLRITSTVPVALDSVLACIID